MEATQSHREPGRMGGSIMDSAPVLWFTSPALWFKLIWFKSIRQIVFQRPPEMEKMQPSAVAVQGLDYPLHRPPSHTAAMLTKTRMLLLLAVALISLAA